MRRTFFLFLITMLLGGCAGRHTDSADANARRQAAEAALEAQVDADPAVQAAAADLAAAEAQYASATGDDKESARILLTRRRNQWRQLREARREELLRKSGS